MIIEDSTTMEHHEVLDKSILAELFHPKRYPDVVINRYSVAHAFVPPHQSTLPHILTKSSEVYYILSGEGIMHIDTEAEAVRSGHLIYIPPGSVQYIENTGSTDLSFLAIVDPMWQEADEILTSCTGTVTHHH